jgi:DivIVA domain-containing protein
MATLVLVLVVVLVLAALVFGVISMLSGDDPGLSPVEPDGRARPLPNNRSLSELDLKEVRFDLGLRGYRMSQVDRVLRRTAYDLGYKDEMIAVLEAEVMALRDGRTEDAELLRKARESAANPAIAAPSDVTSDDEPDGPAEPAEHAQAADDPAEVADDPAEAVDDPAEAVDDPAEAAEEPSDTMTVTGEPAGPPIVDPTAGYSEKSAHG